MDSKKRDLDADSPRPNHINPFPARAQVAPPTKATQQDRPRLLQTTILAPTSHAPVTRCAAFRNQTRPREGVHSTFRSRAAAPDPSSNTALKEQWMEVRSHLVTAAGASLARKEQSNAAEAERDGFVYVESPRVQRQIDELVPPRFVLPAMSGFGDAGAVYEGGLKVVEDTSVVDDGGEDVEMQRAGEEAINGNGGPEGGLKSWIRPLENYFGKMIVGGMK